MNLLDRYLRGDAVSSFNREEAHELFLELTTQGAYTNPRHPQHESLSRDVSALAQIAHPESIGPGGETVVAPNGGSALTRGAR